MSETTADENRPSASAEPEQDVYLDLLLSVLENDDSNKSEVSVTFVVGGGVISGDLISHSRWLMETRATLEAASDGARNLILMLDALSEKVQQSGEGDWPSTGFVHLRKAQIVTNHVGSMNGIVPMTIKRDLWRGRMSDVQGWSLGR